MWERVCLPLLCLLHLPLFLSGENNSTVVITSIVLIGTSYGGTCYHSWLQWLNLSLLMIKDERITNC